MSTRYTYRNGNLTFFSDTTQERILPVTPVVLSEDFLGVLNGDQWTVIDAGAETELKVANQHGGVFELLFTSKDEKQTPGLYQADRLEFNIDKAPIFEARIAIQTIPTLLCEFFFGMSGATADGTVSTGAGPLIHAFYLVDGSGEIFIRTDDGTTASSIVTTGITVVAGDYHIYRIDMTESNNILFFIDGERVASTTTFDMSTGSADLQAYFRGHKASDVANVYVDTDGTSFASWAGTNCAISDGGDHLLITDPGGGGTQIAVYTCAALTPWQLYKITFTIADGTGAWGAGDSLIAETNAGVTIQTKDLSGGAATYVLEWIAAGATDKIKVTGTVGAGATLKLKNVALGTAAQGALRIDYARAWTTR